jgi:hypothetical protein
MGTSGNIPDPVSETERTIRSGKLLNWKTGVAKLPSSLGTMIKTKNPWNDQLENASQGKVTGAATRHLAPHDNTQPRLGSRYRLLSKNQQKGRCLWCNITPVYLTRIPAPNAASG